mmetsp:Transcript_20662/g.65105  ORF Transcript_20662/g.65105 Transcript_20662/m.65105 type:complete len:233 (-) Transcript_20662:468-1166(-)
MPRRSRSKRAARRRSIRKSWSGCLTFCMLAPKSEPVGESLDAIVASMLAPISRAKLSSSCSAQLMRKVFLLPRSMESVLAPKSVSLDPVLMTSRASTSKRSSMMSGGLPRMEWSFRSMPSKRPACFRARTRCHRSTKPCGSFDAQLSLSPTPQPEASQGEVGQDKSDGILFVRSATRRSWERCRSSSEATVTPTSSWRQRALTAFTFTSGTRSRPVAPGTMILCMGTSRPKP